jgi:N-acyl-L-homoserine lactone synthetase
MELIFQEGNLLVKTLNTPEELEASFRLRHEVFCDELKWVPPSPYGMEKDAYDGFAHPIGLFDEKSQLIGHVRLIPAPKPFMIEKEFACLLPRREKTKKTINTAEVTRLCVKRENRHSKPGSLNVSQLLYKALYQWSLSNNIRYLIMVVEKKYYRLLNLNGFPVKAVADFLPMGDGVKAGVITLDVRNFESANKNKNPELLAWTSKITTHVPSQLLQLEPC